MWWLSWWRLLFKIYVYVLLQACGYLCMSNSVLCRRVGVWARTYMALHEMLVQRHEITDVYIFPDVVALWRKYGWSVWCLISGYSVLSNDSFTVPFLWSVRVSVCAEDLFVYTWMPEWNMPNLLRPVQTGDLGQAPHLRQRKTYSDDLCNTMPRFWVLGFFCAPSKPSCRILITARR